jgi:hypothetical protein
MKTKETGYEVQDALEKKIHDVILETARSPKLIIMHPKTWTDLTREILGRDGCAVNPHDPNMAYKGIKILRSLDVKELEFEFCVLYSIR